MTDQKKEILGLFTQVVHALTVQIDSFRYENKPLGQGLFILNYCAKKKTCIMSDLVRDLNFTPSTATRQVDRLVAMGLADRKQSTSDRRMTELSLTAEGVKISRLFFKHRMKNIGPILKSFNEDELGVLMKLLKSAVDSLR